MKGVFIFAYNERKELALIALAEEPGYAVGPSHHQYNESVMSRFELDLKEGQYCEQRINYSYMLHLIVPMSKKRV